MTFDLWPPKINRIHPPIMDNICAKLDQNTLNGFISIVFLMWNTLLSMWTWPLASDPKSIAHCGKHSFCTKPDQNTLYSLIFIVFTRLFYFCLLWPWPLTSDPLSKYCISSCHCLQICLPSLEISLYTCIVNCLLTKTSYLYTRFYWI